MDWPGRISGLSCMGDYFRGCLRKVCCAGSEHPSGMTLLPQCQVNPVDLYWDFQIVHQSPSGSSRSKNRRFLVRPAVGAMAEGWQKVAP